LASLDEAEARYRTHTQRLSEMQTAAAALHALAPAGLTTLRMEAAAHEARAKEIEQALRQLPASSEQAGEVPTVAAAEADEESARQVLDQSRSALGQTQVQAGNAATSEAAAKREMEAAQNLLDDPERSAQVAVTKRELGQAQGERSLFAARIEALEQQIALARPDILQQDVERYRKSAEQLERSFVERRDTLRALEVELHTLGTQGLEERQAEVFRDLEQARRRLAELQRRAHALDHLLKLLREKRRALTRRLQAPLQRHLNRYLQLLFPQASLQIDEDLSPSLLTRGDTDPADPSDFDTLSFGTREQMGVISRLAYADLLQEAGRATLIILDDALVHSDAARLAQMKRVLFDAAQRHQILLFTCHPTSWRDMGVTPRALEDIEARTGQADGLR
jgi:hypothetical protein